MTTYAEPPTSFEALIAPFPETIRQIAAQLRQQILDLLPEAHEHVSGGHRIANVLYSLGHPNNVVCGLQPAADHCKLFLHHVHPGDVPGVRLEGSGKYVRHVKVRTLAEAQAPTIPALLERARQGARRR